MFTFFNRLRRKSESGFTMIELLVVVVIIAILAAVAVPVYVGIQNAGHKSAVKADVNATVKTIGAVLAEDGDIASIKANNAPYVKVSEKGETIQITDSVARPGTSDFSVIGTESKPAGAIDYTYSYDSATGQFSEGGPTASLSPSTSTSPSTSPSPSTSSSPSTSPTTAPVFQSSTFCRTTGNCLSTDEIVSYGDALNGQRTYYGFNLKSGSVSVPAPTASNPTYVYYCFLTPADQVNAYCSSSMLVTKAYSAANGADSYYSQLNLGDGDKLTCISLRGYSGTNNYCNVDGTLAGSKPGYGGNVLDASMPQFQQNPVQTLAYFDFTKSSTAANPAPNANTYNAVIYDSSGGSCSQISTSTYGYLAKPFSGTTCTGSVEMFGNSYPTVPGKTYTFTLEAEKYDGNGTYTPTANDAVCFRVYDNTGPGFGEQDCTSQKLTNVGGYTNSNFQTLKWTYTAPSNASSVAVTFSSNATTSTNKARSYVRLGQALISTPLN